MNNDSRSKISWTPDCLTMDGKPWFPVMGEAHYSRMRPETWERELLKMKAGGVDIVSTYCIWIHHEEVRNEFDFSGCRNLRGFVEAAGRCGLFVFLRIGPWAHGEVRNGGFPDWLVREAKDTGMVLRSDDPRYLQYVRHFYEAVYEEARDLFLKDGGPVIGIQIENEYGHCGGLTGEEGEQHMRTLTAIARETGFDAPLWTATGWGGAVTGGLLPVMGGYCEAPWDQRITEIEPSGNYVFTAERNDHAIGSDYGDGSGITFDPAKFPYLTAELGGGLQVTKHRRPVVTGKDIGAMSMVKLASGCALLGYYMYHGGTNPAGRLTTLQESRESDYPNDLPVFSYDFQAPVGEYGQLRDSFREIRALSMFVHDFCDEICAARFVPQPGNPEDPSDLTSLRTAVRVTEDGKSGFLFVNNYVRQQKMAEHERVPLKAYGKDGEVLADFGMCDVRDGDFFFLPFGLRLGKAVLKMADAVPLCILHGKDHDPDAYVFRAKKGLKPRFVFERDGSGDSVSCEDGTVSGLPRIIVLSEEKYLRVAKCVALGRERLIISDGDLLTDAQGNLELIYTVRDEAVPSFSVWPPLEEEPEGFERAGEDEDGFACYRSKNRLRNLLSVKWSPDEAEALASLPGAQHSLPGADARFWKVEVRGDAAGAEEILFECKYEGSSAALLSGGRILADSFYTGEVWQTGIKSCISSKGEVIFEGKVAVEPICRSSQVFVERAVRYDGNGAACAVSDMRCVSVWRARIPLT